jgi:hypothetical protein
MTQIAKISGKINREAGTLKRAMTLACAASSVARRNMA